MSVQYLYDRNKYIRTILNKLGFSRPIELILTSPRIVEYPWILRNMPAKGRVLDVGSTGSQLPLMLLGLGYEVWTVDVREYEFEGVNKNLHCIKGDIRNTNFPDSFFDIVIAVSTIEHIGLGRYNDPIDPEGDINAIKEINKILKIRGILMMTVPFGNKSISKLHRVYDIKSLLTLLSKFKIEKIEYFWKSDQVWNYSSLEQVRNVDSSIQENAIVCVKAIKSF